MKKEELKNILLECCNDVSFVHNGLLSGVTVTVQNYIPTWQVWHGNATKEYDNLDELLDDPFYSGKSLNDIIETTEFEFF